MSADHHPSPNRSAIPSAPRDGVDAVTLGLADARKAGGSAAPPHLLWQTLESAFSAPDIVAPVVSPAADRDRLASYVAMPMTLAVSLMLWVVIALLVLTR